MPYFHVRITTKSGSHSPEVELDVGSDELELRFLEPYRLGRTIVVAGKSVNATDLERIQIHETPHDSHSVNAEILARDKARNVIRLVDTQGRLDPGILSQHGVDVTRNYIEGPPGHAAMPKSEPTKELRPETDAQKVFVIHGRNDAAREAMVAFLRAIGLHPLEWPEVVQATGKTSPYIGEILDTAFSDARAVVALFTPDDEVRLREPFRKEDDHSHETELTGQARPNVLFEAGMAMGRYPDHTVLVELGDLRPFSDIAGLHVIRMDGSSQRRQELAQRLGTAGCPVKLDGTDWHTAGDFGAALAQFTLWTSESPDVAEQISSAADPSQLSEEANELLSEAAADKMGMILVDRMMAGVTIKTNGKGFGEMGNRRSEAKWEQAINDLIDHGFVEDQEGTGEVFHVTHRGFQAADGILESNHEA